jgi:thioredoxin 2
MSDPLHLVCPHCLTTNRVQPTQLGSAPNCGQCKKPLFESHPFAANETAFDRHITRDQVPVLVDFWAPWCGPCRMMAPAFEKAAAILEPRMRLLKVNTEEEQSLAARFKIRSIPTLSLFADGREVARQAGALTSADHIVSWARRHVPVAA